MAKKKVTNMHLMGIVVEYENFCKMFPFIAQHLGLDKFITRNAMVINRISEGQHKLLVDNVEFDDKKQPIMDVVAKPIIEVPGTTEVKEDPKYDWRYKSEECKEAFSRQEKELQETVVEITV